jgi:hypothetical protein
MAVSPLLRISIYVARALIEIVDMDEINKRYLENEKYKNSERVGNSIVDAIRNKKLYTEKGRNPCS